jgi:hypothetical protein
MSSGGGSGVMPSHHTSPSGVRATLVKMVLDLIVAIAVGLDFSDVPGATPKNPASGLIACSRPSGPGRIHAMSSPTVVTVHASQPLGGNSIARLVLPQALGNARCDIALLAFGTLESQDQHVLGHPALHPAPSPRRSAARNTSCPGARCRRIRFRRTKSARSSGKCTMYFSSALQGHATSRSPGRQRLPDRMNAGDELSIAQHFERPAAHAGHDPHVDDDVGRIGEFNADVRQRRAQRAPC